MKQGGEVPGLYIEKLLLHELPPGEEEKLLKDPEVRRRVAELEASNRRILAEYPPGAMADAIRRRHLQSGGSLQARSGQEGRDGGLARRRPARQRLRGAVRLRGLLPALGVAIVALAAVVVLATRWTAFFPPQGPAEEIRTKGGPHLVIYRSSPRGAEELRDGYRVAQGDTLQIGYAAAGQAYGVILSLDGRGTVTVHLPAASSRAEPLDQEGIALLPFAYRLDDAPGFERFFLVTSGRDFDLAPVLESVRRLAEAPGRARTERLELPDGLEQTSLVLLK